MGHTIQDDKQLLERASNITCVSDYLEVLKYVDSVRRSQGRHINKSLFFRGYSDASWIDEPSIYRKDTNGRSLIKFEDKLYYEIISRCPDSFRYCNTAIDHLVMMQHYGLPTRLLDITENPLVGLYFACANYNKQTDAKVAIYEALNTSIKNYTSNTVAMLANLAKVDNGFNILAYKCIWCVNKLENAINEIESSGDIGLNSEVIEYFLKLFIESISSFRKKKEIYKAKLVMFIVNMNLNGHRLKSMLKKSLQSQNLMLLLEEIDNIAESLEKEKGSNPNFLDLRLTGKLGIAQLIQSEKPYFDDNKMYLDDFVNIVFVRVKQDNPNIIKQNGAFLLFGVKENSVTKEECPQILDHVYLKIDKNQQQKVACIIKPQYKLNIINELHSLSISESQLFPDITNVAKELKNKYIA